MVDVLTTTDPVVEAAGDDPGGRRLSTARFAATKVGGGLVSLLMVVVLGFFLFRAMPGNPVRTLNADRQIDQASIDRMRREWSLDLPLWRQFIDYLRDLLHGDLGTSYKYKQPVAELLGEGDTALRSKPLGLADVAEAPPVGEEQVDRLELESHPLLVAPQ